MTTRQYSSRSQQTTLTSAITAGASTMTVVSATGVLGGVTIPSGRTFTLVIDPDTAVEEIVDVTLVVSNTLTITRAIDGSSAQEHSAGAVVRHMAIGRDFRDANLHEEADAYYNDGSGTGHAMHGIGSGEGVVVGTLKTQTLTNKTLTSPTITNPNISGAGVDASIVFEGATADAYETTLTVVDPTQDNTITLPNTSGTVILTTATQTMTNKTLTSPVISGTPTITGLSSAGMISSSATPKDYVDSILGSATAAATSAASAATSASSAATSASSAATSASSALTSANSASTSQTAAATSATSAATSASSASTSASSAAASATTASNSAAAAATSATSAATSASSALTSANSASASATASATSASASATSASAAATSATSAAASATAAATSATSAAASATAAATSASSASTSASSALTSANSAATSATSSATSASAAATSATSAATSASSALTSANSASTSAASALTSANSASTSATSAASSAASAAASWDLFDDEYLGSKTSDPTVDNDGNPLVAGTMYFNSVIPAMKVYTGSAWQIVAPDTSNFVDKALWSGKGAVIGASSASTPVALTAPSTTGYILSYDSAATSGLSWIAPNPGDITGVTAGTGLTGGGTSGAVTVSLDLSSANVFTAEQTATRYIVTGSTVPTNGMYLPAANTLGFATNSAVAMRIGADSTVAIGTNAAATINLRVRKNLTGGTSTYQILADPVIQSDVTSLAVGIEVNPSTAASAFTLNNLTYFNAVQGSIGATSTITSQYGFYANSSLTGATNNYGFYGNIASGSNRYNLFMNGTADNYLAGSLGIGSTSLTATSLLVSKNITGAVTSYGIESSGQVQSDVTSNAYYFDTFAKTANAAFTLTNLYHYAAVQGTFGASSVVTNQFGYVVHSSMTGATNNYGFYGNIASGTGRWNLYTNTAANYFGGQTTVGSTSLTLGSGSIAQQFGVVSAAASNVVQVIRGAASQTGNLTEWQNSSGTILSRVNSAGQFVGDGSQLTGITTTAALEEVEQQTIMGAY